MGSATNNGSIIHIVVLEERIIVRRFNDSTHLSEDLHAMRSQMT